MRAEILICKSNNDSLRHVHRASPERYATFIRSCAFDYPLWCLMVSNFILQFLQDGSCINQRDFSSQNFFLAAKSRFFAAKRLGGIAWKNAYLFETTTGFCLKTFSSKYTFSIKNISTFCNAVIQKITRRNPMFSEIFQFFLLISLFLKYEMNGPLFLPTTD